VSSKGRIADLARSNGKAATERVAGVYAFVVKGKIVYIGKATHLRHRVRNYNRYRRTDINRPHREAHARLLTTLSEPGATVQVYVYRATSAAEARECEKRWIKEIDPDWNRADRIAANIAKLPELTRKD
jgi:excinuclease UvrABC nuclease subunit